MASSHGTHGFDDAPHSEVADAVPAPAQADQLSGLTSARAAGGAILTPAGLIALQRTIGNRRARELVATAGAEPDAQLGRRVLARQRVQMVSGRYVGDLEGAEANVREDVLTVMDNLLRVWSITTADHGAETAVVQARPASERLTAATIPRTIAGLRRNEEQTINNAVAQTLLGVTLTAPVGRGFANAKADVLALQGALNANWNITNAEVARESAAVNAGPDPVRDGDIPATLAGIGRFKQAYVGGASRRGGPMAATNPQITPQQIADRDAALITPGTQTTTTTVGGVTQTVRQAFQDVITVRGQRLSYRDHLWRETDALVTYWFNAWGPMLSRPRLPWAEIEAISDAAKTQVDAIFGTYAQFGRNFRHGGPNPNLLDASARPGISAGSLMRYLVSNQQELGVVRAQHNAVHEAGRPEMAIVTTFMNDYMAHGNNTHRLEVVDRAWPALNTGSSQGVVSVQPYEGATPRDTRRVRWTMFQTMIHEYFHTLNHANFYRYADGMPADERSVLVEGGASLMTDLAWPAILAQIQSNAALRQAVEGSAAAYDPGVIPPIREAHYHPQIEQVRAIIRALGAAGEANFRAAFLTGRMELLGYDRATPAAGAAASVGQTYTVPPRDVRTLADVAYNTQVAVEELARLNSLAVNAAVRPGDRLITRGTP